MLTLPTQTHGNILVMGDDTQPNLLYVARLQPRVMKRADGTPAFRLLRWVPKQSSDTTPASELPASGGRLTMDLNVLPTPQELAAAGLADHQTQPMPWLDATIRIEGPQFESVQTQVSIVAGAVAAVSVDLSPDAVNILAPLIQANATSPLQATWLGHVQTRLPAAEVIATANSQEIKQRVEITHGGSQTLIARSILEANARIEIHGIDNADLEQALRQWALDELLARFAKGENLIVQASASDVVRWPIQLAATLESLAAASPDRRLVETFILEPGELGSNPPTELRVLADFHGPLERVDVRLEPRPSGETLTVTLTDDQPVSVSPGSADFRWSHRVKITDRPAGPWSDWRDVHGAHSLLIPVPLPPQLNIEVIAVGLNFESRWESVRVVLEHHAPGQPVASHALNLDAPHRTQTWVHPLNDVRGVLRAQLTYVSHRGQTFKRVLENIEGDQVLVTDPFAADALRLALVPAGNGWDGVALAMVDLKYLDDPYTIEETLELRGLNDFVQWVVPARPDGPKSINWRLNTSFTDGRFTQSHWQLTQPGVLTINIQGQPRRQVQILPIYFDPRTTPSATVELRSGPHTRQIVINDRTPRTETLDPGPFSWDITWTLPDGTQTRQPGQDVGDDVIVLPKFR